jgi:putative transcriptional regulator
MAARRKLQAVAETRAFSEDIDAMLAPAEREAVIVDIAAAPEGGDLMRGTGGLRNGASRCRGGESGVVRGLSLCFWASGFPSMRCSSMPRTNERICPRSRTDVASSGGRDKGAGETMKKKRFDRLVASLEDVRTHVATGGFAGRISGVEVGASDIRAVRERSGLTQAQFAETFGIGLGTLQKWERGERRPSGAAKSLLRVMQADLPAVVRALGGKTSRKERSRAA